MKVYIVGAGAIGTYLGDLLQTINVDVSYAPRALELVTPVDDADVAIVAVKSYDTDGAIETLRRAIPYPQKCVFVSPQNGIGNEEKLSAAFGGDNVVAAALTVPVDRSNGHAHATKEGGLAFAPLGKNAYNWLTAAFGSTGLKVQVVRDWRALKWSKLALNIVANASCAILNVLPNRLVHYDEIFTLEIRAIREVRAVMHAMRITPIDLPRYPVRALQSIATLPSPVSRKLLASRVAGARGTKPPSLLLDLRAGKAQTEVEYLNGAVACAGRDHNVRTPVNAVYSRVLDDIAHMPQLWAKYREHPDTLAGEVEAEVKRVRALARS